MLKEADWLPYICWSAQVSDVLSRQNQVLSCEEDNPIDSLLQSAFEFIDVNEISAATRIVEEAAKAHSHKVRNYFKEICSVTPQEAAPEEMKVIEQTLKKAADVKLDDTDSER